jgi:hypothetical protein
MLKIAKNVYLSWTVKDLWKVADLRVHDSLHT